MTTERVCKDCGFSEEIHDLNNDELRDIGINPKNVCWNYEEER
jgi:hypothetical protein